MDDLISRRAVLGIAFKYCPDDDGTCSEAGTDLRDMLDELENLPSAQPRRGKWIKISPANIYECSECGKSVMTNDICAYDFCHGCGAEMRQKGENNESN